MKNMTPEQEARYALDFGVARSDLPEDAQLAYDRLAEQRRVRDCASAVSDHAMAAGRAIPARGAGVSGVALIAAGGIVFIAGCVRFAAEGVGVPVPTEPNSRQLTVGGPYRYVRNPLYLAWVMAIAGQALLLSRPVLLFYAAGILIASAAFVHWYEEPTLASRFGEQYEAYRKQVPGWWPRWPRRNAIPARPTRE